MAEPSIDIISNAVPDSPLELLLRGITGIVHQQETDKRAMIWSSNCKRVQPK